MTNQKRLEMTKNNTVLTNNTNNPIRNISKGFETKTLALKPRIRTDID